MIKITADFAPFEFSLKRGRRSKRRRTTWVRGVYLIIFDKPGRSLSGWHYAKVRNLGGESIQKSAIGVDDIEIAREIVGALRKYGVNRIRVYRAVDVTSTT